MKIILTSVEKNLFEAWTKWCKFDFVDIFNGSIFENKTDAVISPSNGFGFCDGGIDAVYMKHFGEHVESRLQGIIKEDYDGELLVGQAVLVKTKNTDIPFVVAAPTMRVPMRLPKDTINPYLAARAAIQCVLRANEILKQYKGDPNAKEIQTLSFPGMGTGVGGIDPNVCAYQVGEAIKDTLMQRPMFPYNWQDALYRHDNMVSLGEYSRL